MNLPPNSFQNQYYHGQFSNSDANYYPMHPSDQDKRLGPLPGMAGMMSNHTPQSNPTSSSSLPVSASSGANSTAASIPNLPTEDNEKDYVRLMPPLLNLTRMPQSSMDIPHQHQPQQQPLHLHGNPSSNLNQMNVPLYGLMPSFMPLSFQMPAPYMGQPEYSLPYPQGMTHPIGSVASEHTSMAQSPMVLNPPTYQVESDPNFARDYRYQGELLASTYKPLAPKKNSKPRINKLDKSGDIKQRRRKDSPEVEPSMDLYWNLFQRALSMTSTPGSSPILYSLESELEQKLFDLFIHQVSRCMNVFVEDNFFSEIVPYLALHDETGMIKSSMLSLSALILQRLDPDSVEESVPMDYYHQTITAVRKTIQECSTDSETNNGRIERCLLSTILLGVYEMFFLASDNTYVKGAVGLMTSIMLKLEDLSPIKSSPFLQMCFWAMFICDIILSLKFNNPTMFSVRNFWYDRDPEFIEEFLQLVPERSSDKKDEYYISKKDTIWWLHRILIDFSIINEFNLEVTVLNSEEYKNDKAFYEWLALNERLEDFERNLPIALKPLIYKPGSPYGGESHYPTIFFRDELAAFITLQLKIAQISLYQALIQKTNLESPKVQEFVKKIPKNHAKLIAKDVIGILRTYDQNIYLWPINIHTIRHVARYLHDDVAEYKELEYITERVITTCHFVFKSQKIIG